MAKREAKYSTAASKIADLLFSKEEMISAPVSKWPNDRLRGLYGKFKQHIYDKFNRRELLLQAHLQYKDS